LTVYLSPSKVTVIPLNRSIGTSLPPASTDSTVQAPWNFLSSFSTSAMSSTRAPVAPDAVSTRVQSSVTSAIRIRVLLYLRLTCVAKPEAREDFPVVDLFGQPVESGGC